MQTVLDLLAARRERGAIIFLVCCFIWNVPSCATSLNFFASSLSIHELWIIITSIFLLFCCNSRGKDRDGTAQRRSNCCLCFLVWKVLPAVPAWSAFFPSFPPLYLFIIQKYYFQLYNSQIFRHHSGGVAQDGACRSTRLSRIWKLPSKILWTKQFELTFSGIKWRNVMQKQLYK